MRRLAVRQPVVRRPHREERITRHERHGRRPEGARNSLKRVSARGIVARRAVERHRRDGTLRHGEFPDERAVVAIAPRAPDDAVLRLVCRLNFPETPVCERRQLEAAVEAAVGTGTNPRGSAEEPVGKRSVGVVVEAVHVHGTEPLLLRVAVPALPHRRCALAHREEPARVLVLEQKRIRGIGTVGVAGKRVEDLRRPEEARLQASAVVFDVLQERRDGSVLCRAVVKPQPQREDDRRLQVTKYLQKPAVGLEEVRLEIPPRRVRHLGIPLRVFAAAGRLRHVGHPPCVHQPVASAEIVEVLLRFGEKIAPVPLVVRRPGTGRGDLLVRDPVAPLEAVGRAMLRQGDPVDIARHRIPVLLDYPRVARHAPRRPRHGNARVGPAETAPHDRAPAHQRRNCGIEPVLAGRLRVAHVRHPLGKKTVRVGEAKRRRCEHLRVAAPAHPLVALRTVGRD